MLESCALSSCCSSLQGPEAQRESGMLLRWLLYGAQRAGSLVSSATGHFHVCQSFKLLVLAETAFSCLQVGVKRGGRRGPAFHRAKPFAHGLGRHMADLAQAGGNGQDAVMFLGSQGALLGAVQVCIRGRVPAPTGLTVPADNIPIITTHQEESLLGISQPEALLLSVLCTVLLNAFRND